MNPVSLCRSYYRRASLTGITLPPVFHVKQVPDCGGGAVILRSGSSAKKEGNRSELLNSCVRILQDAYLEAHPMP
jgi:hypothetical protein